MKGIDELRICVCGHWAHNHERYSRSTLKDRCLTPLCECTDFRRYKKAPK